MRQCLVVDDSDVIRKVAKAILKALNYETIEAENGQVALEKCNVKMPDAILVDWHMPVMGGIEFLNSLRLQAQGRSPTVFYCTTENDHVDIARALAAGADDYILKPFDREAIRSKFADAGMI
jgi:two-component system, chemotaxis family, chemotaxis protein CheY